MQPRPALLQPATLLLVAVNLVPLIGVYAWGWDGFVLLMLYWLETASIAFWTIVRIVATPREAFQDAKFAGAAKPPVPILLAIFIAVHAGVFMAVHLLFLWAVFSGAWSRKIHGIDDFVREMIVGTGLWLPLLALFVGRGLLTLYETIRPALLRHAGITEPAQPPAASAASPGAAIVLGLYVRIFVMQITIILGMWMVLLSGTRGTLALVIAVKTAADIAVTLYGHSLHTAREE
jgi:hypothetical protein